MNKFTTLMVAAGLVIVPLTGLAGERIMRPIRLKARTVRSLLAALALVAGMTAQAPHSSAEVEDITTILEFFDTSVDGGTLFGVGPGRSALGRQGALLNMLESAGALVDADLIDDACVQLLDAQNRTDGLFPPPDFVAGSAAPELAELIDDYRFSLTCDLVLVAPGEGTTIEGLGGTTVTVEPDSIPYEALIGIEPALPSKLVGPLGDLEIVGAVELTLQPTAFNASVAPPTAPLEISIPAPIGMPPGTQFLVAQQILSDSLDDNDPGLKEQFVAIETAEIVDGNLVTQPHIFGGIFAGGLFAFLIPSGTIGFATGTVSDASGARPGTVVSNNTNTLVSITTAAGQYTLPINGGFFNVTGFDPFRGSSGSSAGVIISDGETVMLDIFLTPLAAPPIVRDGIRNGGFERGDVTSWAVLGAGGAIQQLGPTSTGIVITPTEGNWMADISTGAGSVGDVGSSLRQLFRVPAGVQTLRLDFNFVSEEFPEFVGSIFDDSFNAVITTPNGQSTIAQVSVNNSGGFALIGDCFFPGGDSTCGQTGWRQASVDLSAFAGTNQMIQVDLLFSSNDAGDNIFDTHVLVDNIRFSTLWVDAKILQGPTIAANANAARVTNEVRQVNEILSQAGINVRIRNTQTVNVTNALVDTDITWTTGPNCADGRVNGILTAEETSVLGLVRSTTNTDLNVYYVRSGTGLAGVGGFALGPDDFCVAVNILNSSGTFQMDIGMGGNVLAHEVGHIVISPQTAGNVLEHNAPAGNFLSTTPALGVVTRQQSANINRAGAPLLLP